MNINEKKVYGWLKNYEYMMCIINDNKKECEDKILELQSKAHSLVMDTNLELIIPKYQIQLLIIAAIFQLNWNFRRAV